MSKIEKELLEATGLKTKKGEKRPDFLKRVHTAVMKLSDEDWDKLTDPAQKWANAGTKAVEKEADLAEFPDVKAEASEEVEEETEAKEEAPKKAAASTKDKPKAESKDKPKAEAKAPAAKAEKAAPKKKGPGRIEQMKTIMLKSLGDKADDLKAKLVAAGIEVSDATITTVRSDFMSSLRVLKKAGKLEEKLAAKIGD